MFGYDGWRGPTRVSACAAAAILVSSASAGAFELKHTSGGAIVRWDAPSVEFAVDPSVEDSVVGGGGAQATAEASHMWSGASGAPQLATAPGNTGGKPAVDGLNSILFAPDGFAPAGNALAITVLTYEEQSGQVIDADIVINGVHRFAAMPAGMSPPEGMVPMATEGGSSPEHGHKGSVPFDLEHVVSHEIGHALGLGDEQINKGSIMYAYSTPGDSSMRAPTSDDLDGLDAVYSGSPAASAGCSHLSVAGTRLRPTAPWLTLTFAIGAGVWLTSRRRARKLVPVCAALAVLVARPAPAHSAPGAVEVQADATAHVVSAATVSVDGVFQTRLDLAPSICRAVSCPARVYAHVWGGTIAGITQQVGESPAPRVGEDVQVAMVSARSAFALAAPEDAVEVTVLPASTPVR